MRIGIGKDINGQPFAAYIVDLPGGNVLEVDKALADMHEGGAEEFVAWQTVLSEKELGTRRGQ